MQFHYQSFDSGTDIAAQRELFRECFPETLGEPAGSLEHYNWKFHTAPAIPPSHEYSAVSNGEMIGYYAAIPYRYRIAGRNLIAGMVCDVMTHPKARGKGVFTKLGAYSLDRMRDAGIDFVTGYPVRPEVIPGHLKVGWTIVQQMPVYVKVLRATTLLRPRHLGFLAPLANAAAAIANALVSLPSSHGYSVTGLSSHDLLTADWYPSFLERWIESIPHALRKDSEFLRWRLGAPGAHYRIFLARSDAGEPVGVCIARPTSLRGLPTLALLDLMILPGHSRAFPAIDQALRIFARDHDCDLIATMIAVRWARRHRLRALLYLKSPHVFSLIVRGLKAQADHDELLREDAWHVMWIDSDDL